MPRCPECEAEIEADELDEFDVDIGDRLVCSVCAASLEVVRVAPVELEVESDDAPADREGDGVSGAFSEDWDEDDGDDDGDEWDL